MDAAKKDNGGGLTFGSDNEESRGRLRELILYIAKKCQDDPTFDMVKLNEILYRADFTSFARYGESITNAPYRNVPYEAVPLSGQPPPEGDTEGAQGWDEKEKRSSNSQG